MKIKYIGIIVGGLFVLSFQSHAVERVADKLMRKFEYLIVGEFDNYNQVNFQNNGFLNKADIPYKKHARLYKRVTRIEAPQLGRHVYNHQFHEGGKDKPIYRQAIQVLSLNYKTNSIIAENYTFLQPEKFTDLWEKTNEVFLTFDDLKAVGEHCQSEYRLLGNSFIGGIDKSKCKVKSKKFGYLNLSTQQMYSKEAFWHLEEGFLPTGKMLFGRKDNIPHKLKRAKNYRCWAAIKINSKNTNSKPIWEYSSNIIIHNQGDVAEFFIKGKKTKHYFIRLKEAVFPAGNRQDVFEMFIHENSIDNNNKALSYTWTNASSSHIGINLRWMKASCNSNLTN